VAKAGCARVAFPIVKREREGGRRMPVNCPRLPCEGEPGPLAAHVCLERAMFYSRFKMVGPCCSYVPHGGPAHINSFRALQYKRSL
jgi:hypothetical protein